MKKAITSYEWYPVYRLVEPKHHPGNPVKEISEELLARYEAATTEHYEVQNEIRKLLTTDEFESL